MRFEIFQAKNGKYVVRLRNDNDIILYHSPSYTSFESARKAVDVMKKNGLKNIVNNNYLENDHSLFDLLEAPVEELTSEKFPGSANVGSIRTFLSYIEKLEQSDDFIYFYRGHSNFNYELLPSIYRSNDWIKNEDKFIKEIILKCPNEFSQNNNTFQHLVKMQHYSLPTRLLDLTTNALIALFFACEENDDDGEVIVLKIPKEDIKYFDDDYVSLIANISKQPFSFNFNDLTLIHEQDKNFDISKLLHDAKKDGAYWPVEIDEGTLNEVFCVKPKMDNQRIIRQDGAFLLYGINISKAKAALLPEQYRNFENNEPIIIKKEDKSKIRSQLEALGISNATVYPEIESVANYIKTKKYDNGN